MNPQDWIKQQIAEVQHNKGTWIQMRGLVHDWVGLVGDIRPNLDPWSDHVLEMQVAWSTQESEWHEVYLKKHTLAGACWSIRPLMPRYSGRGFIGTVEGDSRTQKIVLEDSFRPRFFEWIRENPHE